MCQGRWRAWPGTSRYQAHRPMRMRPVPGALVGQRPSCLVDVGWGTYVRSLIPYKYEDLSAHRQDTPFYRALRFPT